jgi:hypothetical protein
MNREEGFLSGSWRNDTGPSIRKRTYCLLFRPSSTGLLRVNRVCSYPSTLPHPALLVVTCPVFFFVLYSLLFGPVWGHHRSRFPIGKDWNIRPAFSACSGPFGTPLRDFTHRHPVRSQSVMTGLLASFSVPVAAGLKHHIAPLLLLLSLSFPSSSWLPDSTLSYTFCLNLCPISQRHSLHLEMAASYSETLVSCRNTTRRHNAEELNLNLHCRENLTSRICNTFVICIYSGM